MTAQGILYISSLLYLTGVICFSISLNENESVARIVSETVRRWVKFLVFTAVIAAAVHFASR